MLDHRLSVPPFLSEAFSTLSTAALKPPFELALASLLVPPPFEPPHAAVVRASVATSAAAASVLFRVMGTDPPEGVRA